MTRKKKVVQTVTLPIILTIITGIHLDITEARTRGAVGLDHRAVGRSTSERLPG
jgi:hypothetical protein